MSLTYGFTAGATDPYGVYAGQTMIPLQARLVDLAVLWVQFDLQDQVLRTHG